MRQCLWRGVGRWRPPTRPPKCWAVAPLVPCWQVECPKGKGHFWQWINAQNASIRTSSVFIIPQLSQYSMAFNHFQGIIYHGEELHSKKRVAMKAVPCRLLGYVFTIFYQLLRWVVVHTLPEMQEKRCPTYGPFSSLECLDHSEPDLKK